MNEYKPPQPSGGSPFADWAKKVQGGLYGERRMLFDSGSFSIHTPGGVMHRPKGGKRSRRASLGRIPFIAQWVAPTGFRNGTTIAAWYPPDISATGAGGLYAPTAVEQEGIWATLGPELDLDAVPQMAYSILKFSTPIPGGWTILVGTGQSVYGNGDVPEETQPLVEDARLGGIFIASPDATARFEEPVVPLRYPQVDTTADDVAGGLLVAADQTITHMIMLNVSIAAPLMAYGATIFPPTSLTVSGVAYRP